MWLTLPVTVETGVINIANFTRHSISLTLPMTVETGVINIADITHHPLHENSLHASSEPDSLCLSLSPVLLNEGNGAANHR